MRTRERLLEATRQVIQARGSARATTKDIARAAGVAEGTLFKYFERKDDLLLAVVQEHLPSFLAVTQPEQAGSRTVVEQLETIAHAAISYYAQLVPLVIAICGDTALLTRQRDWMQAQQVGPRRLFERVADYIAAEQHLGRLDAERDAMSIATLLLGPAFQYAFLRYFMDADPLPVSEQQLVADLVQALLQGAAA